MINGVMKIWFELQEKQYSTIICPQPPCCIVYVLQLLTKIILKNLLDFYADLFQHWNWTTFEYEHFFQRGSS